MSVASGEKADICSFCMCTNHPADKGLLEMEHTHRTWDIFDPALDMTFCLLHMKLRITEKLFQLAVEEAYSNQKKTALQSEVRDLGVNMTIQRTKTKKGLKMSITSMNGRDCEKVMAAYSSWVPSCGANPETCAQMLDLWKAYNKLFHGLNGRYDTSIGPGPDILDDLRKTQVQFGETFLDLYDKSDVTPYIHVLTEHSVDHLERFKALWRYSNEGFEHANKRHRYWYGRCTQRGGICGRRNQYTKPRRIT